MSIAAFDRGAGVSLGDRPTSDRLYYLDALRAFAILYGILVHVGTTGVPLGLGWISKFSGFFRMGLFFLVSGYFAHMTMRRYSARDFLRRRTVALCVPLVAGLILLNPATNWLIYTYHNGAMPFFAYVQEAAGSRLAGKGPMVWHLHLWFLISLIVYVLLAPPTMALLSSQTGAPMRHLVGWLAQKSAAVVILSVALFVGMSCVTLRVSYEIAFGEMLDDTLFHWLVPITTYYWPFFFVGIVLFAHPGLSGRFHVVSLTSLAVGIVVGLLGTCLPLPGQVGEAIRIFTHAFCSLTVIALLMAMFRRFLNYSSWLSRVARYVYSIYILHFLVIYVVAHAIWPLGLGPYATYAVIAALTLLVVLTIHRCIIEPVPLLQLLFNGKPLGRIEQLPTAMHLSGASRSLNRRG